MTSEKTLQEVADRQAITDLLYRYCRAMDRVDHELGYALWHEDGVADYGEQVFQGSGRDFIDHVCRQHQQLINHSHQITNIIIELDGDRAGSESYAFANLRMEREGKLLQFSVWSRYVDEWSKRNGRWGIDRRVAIIDMDEVREVQPMSRGDRWTRDTSDPSYQVLRAR